MTITNLLFSWLVRSALLGLLILLVGSGIALGTVREPAWRLRMIELVLCACLLAPLVGMVPGYPQLFLGRLVFPPLLDVRCQRPTSSRPTRGHPPGRFGRGSSPRISPA